MGRRRGLLSARCPCTCHSAWRSQSSVKPGRKGADVRPDSDRTGSAPARGSGRRGRRRTSSNCATRAQLRTVVPGLPYVGSGRWRVCQTCVFVTGEDCQRRNVANVATLHHRGSVCSAGKEPENNKRGSRNVVQCLLKHTSMRVACLLSAVLCVLCYYTVPYHQLVVKDISFAIAGLPVMSFIQAWAII